MLTLEDLITRLAQGLAVMHRSVSPVGEPPPALLLLLIVGGLVLALWGARLLRGVYVLSFMAAGAMAGVQLAKHWEVDNLIGLVLGGGAMAIIGHLMYRWWVSVTAAQFAMIAVLLAGGADLWNEAKTFADAYTGDASSGIAVSVTTSPTSAMAGLQGMIEPAGQGVLAFWRDLSSHMWSTRESDLRRLAIFLAAAGLLGLVLGLALPRFTTIVGTAGLGVLALSVGVLAWVAHRRPDWWEDVQAHPKGLGGGVLAAMLLAMLIQARQRRGVLPATAAPPVPTDSH